MNQQKYKPAWICIIFGHKWWLTENNVVPTLPNEPGATKRETTHKEIHYCKKCGTRNPNTMTDEDWANQSESQK